MWLALAHCAGVLATIDSACTPLRDEGARLLEAQGCEAWHDGLMEQRHPASSSARAPFTSLCRSNGPTPAKASDTTMTLKCVSDPRGTLCAADSLSTSKCVGENAASSLDVILPSTRRLSASLSAMAADQRERSRCDCLRRRRNTSRHHGA